MEVPTALSYRNQSIDLLWKSMVWFLYDRDLRHERVNRQSVTKIVRKKCYLTIFHFSRHPIFTYLSVFIPKAGEYGPENTSYLDTFHVVLISDLMSMSDCVTLHSIMNIIAENGVITTKNITTLADRNVNKQNVDIKQFHLNLNKI